MSFYALLVCGTFLLLWGSIVKNTGNGLSFLIVKLLPACLGIWALWEAALLLLAK